MGKKKKAGGSPANRNYKDTVFRMLFKDKRRMLELYNAVSGRSYSDPEALEIVMLESAVYMGMRNDLSFLIDMNLYLFEHQSTVNLNMPLRFLQYVSAEYEKLIHPDDLHREKLVRIPTPHFMVFYNGMAPCKEKLELKLSDAFYTKEDNPELELWVQVLNINSGFNEDLKEQCRTLKEYMEYVDKVREYARDMTLEAAVNQAVDECIRKGVLRDFLQRNRAEVMKRSIFEYDDEAVKRVLRKDAFDDGMEAGKAMGHAEATLDLLEEIGTIPEELRERILSQKDLDILKAWHRLAARAKSVEEFSIGIGDAMQADS